MKKTPELSRRSLLKAGSAFAGASVFGVLPLKAFAQSMGLAPADHCFIFAYFSGGWDVLLSLDPRDPAVFTPERISETRILPDYGANPGGYPTTIVRPEGSNIDFGPAIGNMANHFDVMSVVRGINMNTVAHEVGYRYFLTGKEPNGAAARGSTLATEIVGQMVPTASTKVPVPNVAYSIESYNDRYPGYANALRVSSQQDLLLTLAPSPTQLDSEIEQALIDLKGNKVSCEADLYNSRGLVGQYRDSLAQMQTVLGAQLDKYFRFANVNGDSAELNAYRAAIRSAYGLGDGTNTTTPAARAATAAAALKLGVSQCVSMNIVGGLDTHFNRQQQNATNQRSGWNALAALVTDLKSSEHPNGGKWMDHTTVLVFSEFSRTPLTNSTGGRDHHISNSCMLLGKGIQHNRVFGKSGDVGMAAGLIDFETGLPSPNGQAILPDHVVATVMKAANIDYSITRVEPLNGLLA